MSAGDSEFRSSDPVVPPLPPYVPLQPTVATPPVGDLSSPLTFAPLFEQRVLGDGIRPLGDIFINRGALAPSYIAQVFGSSDAGGDGNGHGFLGFGGGDGGVFSQSTLSVLFGQETAGDKGSLKAFDDHGLKVVDVSQGMRGVFGAPSLTQQLQLMQDTEQRQVRDLAKAFEQVGISEMPA